MTADAPDFDGVFFGQLETLLRWRRDVRSFRKDPVPEAMLDKLFDLAALAPSVGLSQPWRFVRVDDPARRAKVRTSFEICNAAALANQIDARAEAYARLKLAGLDDAPVHIAVCVDDNPAQGHGLGRRTMPETTAYSAVMAIHTFWLAARAAGLGVGWVSILDPGTVLAALDAPVDWKLVGYFCIGYPAVASAIPELERLGWEQRRKGGVEIVRR